MSVPLLWHFPISHFNEKVRWALNWKRVPHRREALSASYPFRAWWATGHVTLPVLHLGGRAIRDSTAILAALERTAGNQKQAAEELGMTRKMLMYRLDKLGLPRPRKAPR